MRHRVQMVGAEHGAVGVVRPLPDHARSAPAPAEITERNQVAPGVHNRPELIAEPVVLNEELVEALIARPPHVLPGEVLDGLAAADLVILALGFVLGFVMLPSYSLAAAHAYDRASPDDIVETSAGLLILYGVGSIVGPVLGSVGMGIFGPGGLFLTIAIGGVLLAFFVAVRIKARARPREEIRSDFDYASTAAVAGTAVTPELIAEDDPSLEMPSSIFSLPSGSENDPDPSLDTIEAPLQNEEPPRDIDSLSR